MAQQEDRFLWILVFFDLPVLTQRQRKIAATFRKALIKDGYIMLQFSVYARLCRGEERAEKHIARLKMATPPQGQVRVLKVTDRQYNRMMLLVGKREQNEEKRTQQLVLF